MPDLIWAIDVEDGVFLTFDDGPTPGVTEWILSTLDKYGAKATFFVLGKNVEMYPDLYRRILDAGHKVGNHTYSHQKGWGMSLERYTEDVDFANDLVHSELFRPPYARITPAQARFLGQRYKLVMWHLSEERHEIPRAGCHRGVPRQRKGFPQHALCASPHAGEDSADGPQMQGHRALKAFCGRLRRAVAPGIGISGFFS